MKKTQHTNTWCGYSCYKKTNIYRTDVKARSISYNRIQQFTILMVLVISFFSSWSNNYLFYFLFLRWFHRTVLDFVKVSCPRNGLTLHENTCILIDWHIAHQTLYNNVCFRVIICVLQSQIFTQYSIYEWNYKKDESWIRNCLQIIRSTSICFVPKS